MLENIKIPQLSRPFYFCDVIWNKAYNCMSGSLVILHTNVRICCCVIYNSIQEFTSITIARIVISVTIKFIVSILSHCLTALVCNQFHEHMNMICRIVQNI